MADEDDEAAAGATLETRLREFVELERDLSERAAVTAPDVGGAVVDVDRVDAGQVPEEYPVAITTDAALRLDVRVTEATTVSAYLEWPDEYAADNQLVRLLEALDLGPDEFAELYGQTVALAYRGGHHVIDVERTAEGEFRAAETDEPAESRPAVRRPVPGTEADVLRDRTLAFVVDLIVVGSVAGVLWSVFFVLQLAVAWDGSILGVVPVGLRALLWVLVAGIVGAYYGVLDGPYDGTVGKRAAGVTVATTDGRPVGARAAALRTAVLVAPLPVVALLHASLWIIGLPLGLLLWAGWLALEGGVALTTDRHRRIGDYVAGTVVVEAE